MALWQIDIQKQLGSEYWTNVYHVNVAGQAAAAAIAEVIAGIEQDVHLDIVTFTSYRVRPYPPAGVPGTVYPLGYNGQNPSGSYLPLWNTINVVFQAAQGRPSRKYLRIPVVEVAQENGVLTPTYLASFQDNYATPLEAIPELVDVDSEGFGAIRVLSTVGMRQLRRGSRRRVTPVI
jgi:hypothetical protein